MADPELEASRRPATAEIISVPDRLTAVLLTDSDLDVISGGGVFEVVDGAHHVQGHVADVVRMKGGLVGNPRHHHVGVTDRLHLDRKTSENIHIQETEVREF